MILNATQLHKAYRQPGKPDLQVLAGTDFTLDAGETVAITGPSGSGKSTLLALLAGLDRPDKGTISIDGNDITKMDQESLTTFRGKNIGIIFQQFHLMPHLSAAENISLPLEIHKSDKVEQKVASILDKTGLTDRKHHLPRQLSGGECQRVAIARALAIEPNLLLADEPTGNLDTTTGATITELLFQLVEEIGMTMVVVTHNPSLAKRCARSVTLSQGKLV
jgi:putative ABC transport system ATP-binding protein